MLMWTFSCSETDGTTKGLVTIITDMFCHCCERVCVESDHGDGKMLYYKCYMSMVCHLNEYVCVLQDDLTD